MTVNTRSQKLAVAAHASVAFHVKTSQAIDKEYVTFVKKFPALIHTCGLAQSIAFAMAKKQRDYVADLAAVLRAAGHPEVSSPDVLDSLARNEQLSSYIRLSRDALQAASWLKRYVEVLGDD